MRRGRPKKQMTLRAHCLRISRIKHAAGQAASRANIKTAHAKLKRIRGRASELVRANPTMKHKAAFKRARTELRVASDGGEEATAAK